MEGNKKTKPRAILVFGAPCSGKTTFCEKFSPRFKAPYYNLKQLREEADLTEKQIHVVREGVKKRLRLCGYNPSLIWIQTDINTIKARLKMKTRSIARAKEEYETKIRAMEAPAELEKPIILSGKHVFETQLQHVLSGLDRK